MKTSYEGIRAAANRRRAQFVQQIVCAVANIEPRALLTPTRSNARIAFARQVAMYLAHVVFGLSFGQIAKSFGRDRSTAAYACRVIEDMRDDFRFDAWLQALERSLKGFPFEEPAPKAPLLQAPPNPSEQGASR